MKYEGLYTVILQKTEFGTFFDHNREQATNRETSIDMIKRFSSYRKNIFKVNPFAWNTICGRQTSGKQAFLQFFR